MKVRCRHVSYSRWSQNSLFLERMSAVLMLLSLLEGKQNEGSDGVNVCIILGPLFIHSHEIIRTDYYRARIWKYS